jgi:hypothetical protein
MLTDEVGVDCIDFDILLFSLVENFMGGWGGCLPAYLERALHTAGWDKTNPIAVISQNKGWILWPNLMLMQQLLDPHHQGAGCHQSLEKIYPILFLGLMESFGAEGREVSVEARAGGTSLSLFVKYVVLSQGRKV